mmetsp:Transcript_50316/g.116819  ORF Transcript_50316/g.116819 Transcript_50316/m.116819 type:complete len:215 (+) Transcript_50316:1168-1812(+)
MEEFALNTSSRKATSASGRNPSTFLRSSSFSKAFKDSGPKTSSGTEKRVSKRSKKKPSQTCDSLRANKLFAVPGGPKRKRCSPLRAASSRSFASTERSTRPSVSSARACSIFCAKGGCSATSPSGGCSAVAMLLSTARRVSASCSAAMSRTDAKGPARVLSTLTRTVSTLACKDVSISQASPRLSSRMPKRRCAGSTRLWPWRSCSPWARNSAL